MNEFKVGDIIGQSTMDGLFLLEITDISYNKDEEICLEVKILRKPNLEKPIFTTSKYITLPQQRYEIITKKEYFDGMRSEIKKKQNILNNLIQQYIVTK